MFYLLDAVVKHTSLTGNNLSENFTVSVILAAIVAFISYKYRFLTKSGITATCIMAIVIFTLGSWKWIIPMCIFFVFSSILSKIREKRNKAVETIFEKAGQRDYMQVIANGGIASFIIILNYVYPSEILYAAYIAAIASSCADTWGTETGTMSQYKTYNILTFRRTEQGMSGGISVPGLAGAAAGAGVIAISSIYWVKSNSFAYILVILCTGFTASLIDSILGGAVQVKYKCRKCGTITEREEHCKTVTERYTGYRFFNNDVINLISGAAGAVTGYIITDLILY
jgi:uncharacterized protein (TIGR00297 family)